jgi:molybdenum-dependent DNA-binding transcriptional regulator ModE
MKKQYFKGDVFMLTTIGTIGALVVGAKLGDLAYKGLKPALDKMNQVLNERRLKKHNVEN